MRITNYSHSGIVNYIMSALSNNSFIRCNNVKISNCKQREI